MINKIANNFHEIIATIIKYQGSSADEQMYR